MKTQSVQHYPSAKRVVSNLQTLINREQSCSLKRVFRNGTDVALICPSSRETYKKGDMFVIRIYWDSQCSLFADELAALVGLP